MRLCSMIPCITYSKWDLNQRCWLIYPFHPSFSHTRKVGEAEQSFIPKMSGNSGESGDIFFTPQQDFRADEDPIEEFPVSCSQRIWDQKPAVSDLQQGGGDDEIPSYWDLESVDWKEEVPSSADRERMKKSTQEKGVNLEGEHEILGGTPTPVNTELRYEEKGKVFYISPELKQEIECKRRRAVMRQAVFRFRKNLNPPTLARLAGSLFHANPEAKATKEEMDVAATVLRYVQEAAKTDL